MSKNNGKNRSVPPLSPGPGDIACQVSVVVTKDGRTALLGDSDNLPLMLQLLSEGVAIVAELVEQALPKRIIPAAGPLPPGRPWGGG